MVNRRQVIAGGATTLTLATALGQGRAFAADKEVLIGAIYPLSGSDAQAGIEAKNALETAVDIINNSYDFDLIEAKNAGLLNLGGAKVKVIYADHQGDPEKGRTAAERLITQNNVVALIGCYPSAVTAVVSYVAERYGVPMLTASSSAPSLTTHHLKYFFRPSANDIMYTKTMFDFFDAERAKGKKIETLALFHEDSIFGTDSSKIEKQFAAQRGYKVVADIKYQTSAPSLTSEVEQLRAVNADVLMPSSYTPSAILLTKTMADLGYKPKNIMAQAGGFSTQATYSAVGNLLNGAITRASFSLDMAAKRPSIGIVNDMFKKRSGINLDDNTSRQLMGLLILANAINRAGSTKGDKIRDALAATDIPGDQTIMPWSKVAFNADGQNPYANAVLWQYVEGKFVTIYPQADAAAPAIWPMNA